MFTKVMMILMIYYCKTIPPCITTANGRPGGQAHGSRLTLGFLTWMIEHVGLWRLKKKGWILCDFNNK